MTTWKIPDTINPVDSVCVQIQVPNDETYIATFFGALERLCQAWNYDFDGLFSGKSVAEVWQQVIDNAAEQVRNGENCLMVLDCNEVENCLSTSTIIQAMLADIATNQSDIQDHETRLSDAEISIQQHNLTLNDHETRIVALEQGGGSGASNDRIVTPYILPISADFTDSSGFWVAVPNSKKIHTFTYDDAFITYEFRGKGSAGAAIANYRLMVDFTASDKIAYAKGTDQQSLQCHDHFSGLKGKTVEVELNMLAVAGTAYISGDQNLMCSIDEYQRSPAVPITDVITFDTGGNYYNLPALQTGTVDVGGNPDNCLQNLVLGNGEWIAVEHDLGSVLNIDDIELDFNLSDAVALVVLVDGNIEIQDSSPFQSQFDSQWHSVSLATFYGGSWPSLSGQLVEVRIIETFNNPVAVKMDNILIETS